MKESSKIVIKIPPPLVTLAFMGLMYAIEKLIKFKIIVFGQYWLIAILLVLSAFALFPALREFYKNKTTVNPLKPETSRVLVIEGIYRYSRNPMYLGMALVLLAWCVYLANPLNIFIFTGFILYMNRFQIMVEEEALEKIFGEEFKQYKNNVRRWI